MLKKLFLLDGMALVYRAHFALIARPIFSSKGVNTSALYGFTQTVLEILKNQQPTHIAVAFDTDAPTQRHVEFAEYKATRQAMPEDLSQALPHVSRMLEAFRIPILICDGYEADDIIGTLARKAEGLTGDSAAVQTVHLRRQAAKFFHAGNSTFKEAASRFRGKKGEETSTSPSPSKAARSPIRRTKGLARSPSISNL